MKKFDRVEVLSYISDLYKDVNGVRPRFYNFNDWSDAELEAFEAQLIAQLKENEELERLQEEADVKSFEELVQKTIDLGAGNRKTALRWIYEGHYEEKPDLYWDLDCFLYERGIVHSNLGQQVKKEIQEIYA